MLHLRLLVYYLFFFFKQKTAYEMRISDWSSDVCSSDLSRALAPGGALRGRSTVGRRLNDSSSAFFAFLRFRFTKTSSTWWTFTKSATSAMTSGCMQIGRASCRERVCQYVSI